MKYLSIFLLFFLFACTSNFGTNSPKRIAIQPYDAFDTSIADTIKASIEETFSFDVEVLASIPIPKSAFVNIKSTRYRADSLIRLLKETSLADSLTLLDSLMKTFQPLKRIVKETF